MSYFNELKQNKDLPSISTLENQRALFNAHFKLDQNSQMQFYASFARFLNVTKNLEFKLKSSVKVLQKNIKQYLNTVGNI
jgi:hypothetical protein